MHAEPDDPHSAHDDHTQLPAAPIGNFRRCNHVGSIHVTSRSVVGLVCRLTTRSRRSRDVSAGVRNIFGGRAKSYENELASGVSDALAEMEKQAARLGADAVVGVDVDYESVGSNMLMVSASGTAVKLG